MLLQDLGEIFGVWWGVDDTPAQSHDAGTEQEPNAYQEALGLYEQGCYAEAAEKLVGLFSNNEYNGDEESFTLLVQSYVTQGRIAEALEWCEKAIALEKLNPNLHYPNLFHIEKLP